jgi:citrate lyase beta subunit
VRPEDVRRWAAGRRAGEARERQEQRHAGPSPDAAIAGALALIALAGRLHGWPPPDDVVSRREDLEGYRRWARLRAARGRHASAG